MSYTTQETNLTAKFGQKKQCSVMVFYLDKHDVSDGNRNVSSKTYTGDLEELYFLIKKAKIDHPNGKIEIYLNQYRIKIAEVEVMADID